MKTIVVILATLGFGLPVLAGPLVYSKSSENEPWTPYIKEVISQALAAQPGGQPFTLVPSSRDMVQKRALTLLRQGKELDIYWTMTSKEREKGLAVIRIPLLKGMLGQRLLVIKKTDKARFKMVSALKDLGEVTFGQGHDWPDADVLENAGLKVLRTPNYGRLMQMLDAGRFDAFPLGMNEIWQEIEKRPHLHVMVEPKLVLSYNAPVFLFLAPTSKPLYETLKKGLDAIIENSRFDEIFNRFYTDIISRAKLENRTLIKLDNPNMSLETARAMQAYASLLLAP